MPWMGFDEKYVDTPFRGHAVAGMIGRPYGYSNRATANDFLFRNAEGYDPDGDLPKVKTMKKTPVTEPLPPSILAAIRAAAAEKKKQEARRG